MNEAEKRLWDVFIYEIRSRPQTEEAAPSKLICKMLQINFFYCVPVAASSSFMEMNWHFGSGKWDLKEPKKQHTTEILIKNKWFNQRMEEKWENSFGGAL